MKKQILISILAITAGAMSGCGKQEFAVTESSTSAAAPGSFSVPAKVDILLVEDDTGSMNEAYPQVASQMPALLTSLESKGWDYHFATIPLTHIITTNEVLTSKHDPNWGSQWTAPWPGASMSSITGAVPAAFFRTPGTYTEFVDQNDINNSLTGHEPGFLTIRHALKYRMGSNGFMRSDSMLVIFVVGNGEDTSGVTFCTRSDGITGPCEDVGYPSQGTKASSFNYYKSELLKLRTSASLLKFYAAVSSYRRSNCLGGPAYVGARYMQMATALGGQSFDICSTSITASLDAMGVHLQAQKMNMRTRYLFIDQDANPDTITVTRFAGGDASQASVIPRDESRTNGWTYAGQVENVYAIDFPAEMNLSSGYAIELHGAAKLTGGDTANVTFKPAGTK